MTKLLLDESIPIKLANYFPSEFEISTVTGMGWAGTKNGKLLALAQDHHFNAVITADRGIEYQQNSEELPITVIILITYRLHINFLIPLVPKVVELLEENREAGVWRVELGVPF